MPLVLRGSVLVPVPIERAWTVWVDAARYPQWQGGLLAVRDLSGPVSVVGSTYVLDHGPKLKRQVRVVAVERPVRHVIEQTGVGVHDEVVATFEPEDGGTRLTVVYYGHLNRAMRLLSLLDRGSRSERELQRELDRFAAITRRTAPRARVGGLYLADAGTMRRRLTVLAADPDRVHVRLHPGHLKASDPDDLVPSAPKPPSDQMDLWPLAVPLRASIEAALMGLPFLRRDGGHGVGHLALSLDAWADAAPREIGEAAVTEEDGAAVDAWQVRSAPTVGIDADLELAPLCTFRLEASPGVSESWAAAKVLRSEILKVHLAISADRWPDRPERVQPWTLSQPPVPIETILSGELASAWPLAIGHYPLARSTFAAAKPRFAGVTTLEHEELDGYREWRSEKRGTFDSLAPVAGPGESFASTDPRAPASGVEFGDRARVLDTPQTAGRGLAGRVGIVRGHTTPSLHYVSDVVGESEMDVAVALSFDEQEPHVWFAAELVEFVDRPADDEIVIGDHRLKRAPDGSWTEDDDTSQTPPHESR